jgi:hypothetical protein
VLSKRNTLGCVVIALCIVAVVLASNNVIGVIGTAHQVSNDSSNLYRFEPSSAVATAVGSTTWATSWLEIPKDGSASNTHVAPWNGSWAPDHILLDPTGFPLGDVSLSWDGTAGRNHYIFVGRSLSAPASIYFGRSSDASGSSWTTISQAALVGNSSLGLPLRRSE